MRKKFVHAADETFLHLTLEGEPGEPLERQSQNLFDCARAELEEAGFAREHIVRSRVFGRTREARTAASDTRLVKFAGPARAASSSFILPSWFSSQADVGLDLFAMRPPAGGVSRTVSEHEPKLSYIRWLTWGPMVFLAGMTCEEPGLATQVKDILTRAEGLLRETGCGWSDVRMVSFFLHHEVEVADLLAQVRAAAPLPLGYADVERVEGFSRPGKLVEVEITARKP